jgi:hypothetical protein
MKTRLILRTWAAHCALVLCSAVAVSNLHAQVGTFSTEYRLKDPSLTLTDSAIFPAPNGVGWYVTGTYDDADGDRFSWIMRLSPGGGVRWSFAVTDPLPRPFLNHGGGTDSDREALGGDRRGFLGGD